jgi:hypothetical protein
MKQLYSLNVIKLGSSFALLFIFSLSSLVKAQKADPFQVTRKVPISAEVYGNMKAQGLLNPDATYVISQPVQSGVLSHKKSKYTTKRSRTLTSPPCGYISTSDFQDPWGGQVYFDDAPPAGEFSVPIPFDFCFYGTTFNSFIINNNGNITFDASFTTFSSDSFPNADIPAMIAPFWGDVDTGSDINPLGQVRYDVYPEYAVVSWDSVAVYNEQDNLRNTFQVIISNGTSNVLPEGTNIAFLYGDMQWTTGSASNGIEGFGGTPATVGVNRGDGVDYFLLGRFDAEGTTYDGPFGNNDQVSFLDGKVFFFNACLQSGVQANFAPIAIGAPICDTIDVCVGANYTLDFNFIPVEPGQSVGAELITTSVPGLSVLPSVPGAQCNVSGTFSGSLNNLGYQTVTFTATDDGTPAASFTVDITFNVIGAGNLDVSFDLSDSLFCTSETQAVLSGGLPIGGVYSGLGVLPNGLFNPSTAGTGPQIISYTYTNSSGCSETKTDILFVEICSGLNEQLTSDVVRIFPNPVFDNTTLTVQGLLINTDMSIHLIDGSGREVQKHIISSTNKEKSFEFKVEDLAEGIYSVVVKSEKKTSVLRFIKL